MKVGFIFHAQTHSHTDTHTQLCALDAHTNALLYYTLIYVLAHTPKNRIDCTYAHVMHLHIHSSNAHIFA